MKCTLENELHDDATPHMLARSEAMRDELVQVAAVAVSMVKAIDRARKGGE